MSEKQDRAIAVSRRCVGDRGRRRKIMLMSVKTNKSSFFKCGGISGENRSLIKKKKKK